MIALKMISQRLMLSNVICLGDRKNKLIIYFTSYYLLEFVLYKVRIISNTRIDLI